MNTRYDIETYIANVNADYVSGVTTEHSFRGLLQSLLKLLLNEGITKDKDKVSVINESTRKDYGAPDFELRRDDVAIAFIETKRIGDPDLLGKNSIKHKAQFDRNKKAVNLIAFTDYLKFYLFENGEENLSATIGRYESYKGKEGSTIGDKEWSLTYISLLPTDINVIPRGGVYLFPLFVYDKFGKAFTNFSTSIISSIERRIRLHLQEIEDEERKDGGFLALDLLDYIYAVLHSTRYRQTFHECLQDGFPTCARRSMEYGRCRLSTIRPMAEGQKR